MIPLKTIYDEYIDQPKLTEQKIEKIHFKIYVPSLEWVGTMTQNKINRLD